MTKERFIVHVDMDAFFAAIEQRDNPCLKGRPVIIGADPRGGRGRGVVSTCSYEARRFGVHSAMPISTAYRKCPKGVFLQPDIKKYCEVSGQIHSIFYEFTPDIEPVSIDEAFLDITGSWKISGSPLETCRKIKSRIQNETGLTASVGLAPTKMATKIASDLEKPDGLVEVTRENLADFLRPLDVGRIWGLGEKCEATLKSMGITTIGDLAVRDPGEITRLFGKNGKHFLELANGIDEREVSPGGEAKSVSNETTFEEDTRDENLLAGTLLSLCEKVSSRLRKDGLKGSTVTLKIRFEGFETHTRAATMAVSTNFTDVIHSEIKKLHSAFGKGKKKVRLVGVRVSNLIPADVRETLSEEEADKKKEVLHHAVDEIKERFGYSSICRAGCALKRPAR